MELVKIDLSELATKIKMNLVASSVITEAARRNVNEKNIEIGLWLKQAKAHLTHGDFSPWLDANFNMTAKTAQNYMKVADYFGTISELKNENVFVFQFAALIELTKLPVEDVPKFLSCQENAEKLSVRQLADKIRNFKNPKVIKTIDVKSRGFHSLPSVLLTAAKNAGLEIAMNFKRYGLIYGAIPKSGVLVTRLNSRAINKYSSSAKIAVFTKPLTFIRDDGVNLNNACVIWLFDGDISAFVKNFSTFGSIFFPENEKSTVTVN